MQVRLIPTACFALGACIGIGAVFVFQPRQEAHEHEDDGTAFRLEAIERGVAEFHRSQDLALQHLSSEVRTSMSEIRNHVAVERPGSAPDAEAERREEIQRDRPPDVPAAAPLQRREPTLKEIMALMASHKHAKVLVALTPDERWEQAESQIGLTNEQVDSLRKATDRHVEAVETARRDKTPQADCAAAYRRVVAELLDTEQLVKWNDLGFHETFGLNLPEWAR